MRRQIVTTAFGAFLGTDPTLAAISIAAAYGNSRSSEGAYLLRPTISFCDPVHEE